MIPSVISPEVKSTAERRIFEWFRDDPETEDWVVLHSLGIANHRTVLYGEIDFLVIAPHLGIFALEVKGGRVRRENGVWYFKDKYNQITSRTRSPFEQANEGIFSIFDMIKKRCGVHHVLSKLLFGSGVMFPDITFPVYDLDGEQWQVFDEYDGRNVSGYLRRLGVNTRNKWEEKYGPIDGDKLPDLKTVRELANMLRGNFDKAVSLSRQIISAERELVSLTEEQFRCLDQIEDNSRCLIQGPAGTGKTLLALEEVKRSVAKGEKVAVFCFNNMLGNWLKNYFALADESLRPAFVGTFHSFLYSCVYSGETPQGSPSTPKMHNYFWEELPLLAQEVLSKGGLLFDKVVIDEAQDLINTEYLDVLDLIIKGGISRGKWSLFGDFEMQAIYSNNNNLEEMLEILEERTSFIRYKLKVNCRNTKPIGEEIKYITGFDSSYYSYSKIVGPPVNYIVYKDDGEQRCKVESLLKELADEKVDASCITILSPVIKENSIVSLLNTSTVRDYTPDYMNSVSFSTIHAYKGLENTVIILTDIESFEQEKLMYVGLSRARTALYIFETEQAQKQRNQLLMRWI